MKKLLLIVLIIIGSCSKSVDEDPNEGTLAMPSETLRISLGQVFNVTENTVSMSSDVAAFVESDIVEKGFCWSVDNGIPETPSISDNILPASFLEKSDALVYTEDGQNVVYNFFATLSGLASDTSYLFRPYAINMKGKVFYGPVNHFNTAKTPHYLEVTTIEVIPYPKQVIVKAKINTDKDPNYINVGIYFSKFAFPSVPLNTPYNNTHYPLGETFFTKTLTGLEPNTLYYVRAFAIDDYSRNYVYGDAISFTTPSRGLPTVTTGSANSIGPNVAAFENTVVDDGGSIITSRGLCWSANETLPSISDNKTTEAGTLGIYTSTMLGLLPNTTYHARAYAINEFGIVYGDPVSFTTTVPSDCGTITDVDGNTYTTIKIGNQCWMQQNLNTSRFKNGDDIGMVSGELWRFYPYYNSPAWCYYGNYGNGGDGGYGKLYNLKAVQDLRGLAPVGWHVATNEDWDVLANHLGGYSVAGGKMKSSSNWQAPNIDATNISGFNALPGGAHFFGYSSGTGYKFLSDGWGKSVSYWSFTGARGLSSSHSGLNKGEGIDGDVGYGFYVRCVKD